MGKYTDEAIEHFDKAVRLSAPDRKVALIARLIICLIQAVEESGTISKDEFNKLLEGMS